MDTNNTIQIVQNYHNMVRGVDYKVVETKNDYLLIKNSPGTICIPSHLVDIDRRYANVHLEEEDEEEEYAGAI